MLGTYDGLINAKSSLCKHPICNASSIDIDMRSKCLVIISLKEHPIPKIIGDFIITLDDDVNDDDVTSVIESKRDADVGCCCCSCLSGCKKDKESPLFLCVG